MWKEIVTASIPILVPVIVALLVAILGIVGKYLIALLETLRKAAIKRMGVDEYNARLEKAKQAWGLADEEVRTHPEIAKTIANKQEIFAAWLQKMVPQITPEEIVQLRQTVAGIINAGKAALTVPATAADVAVPQYTGQVIGTVEDTGTSAEAEAQTGADTAADVKVQTSTQSDATTTAAAQTSDTSTDSTTADSAAQAATAGTSAT